MWQSILNGVLGLVVLVVAFLGLTSTALTWTLAILGLLIAIVGFSGSLGQPSSFGERQHSTR